MLEILRFSMIVGAAGLGWLLAANTGLAEIGESPAFLIIATALLAIGLYSSTFGISISELRIGVRTVIIAVTVGVLVKAAIVAGAMYLIFREPRYAVLGLAVAQIDPLAVAAMNRRSRMSERAKALLAAWASFDDPVTVLLTVYGTLWLLRLDGRETDTLTVLPTPGSIWLSMAANVALALAGLVLYLTGRAYLRRLPPGGGRRRSRAVLAIAVVALVGMLTVGVGYSLMLGVALLGLFFRPAIGSWLPAAVQGAFLAAAFMLGIALADGVDLWAGVLLGICAFGAQAVVGAFIPATRLRKRDRAYLAAGQQNGITAIILALLLEPTFPGTVGIVAPAIVVVAVLHAGTNALLDAGLRLPALLHRRTSGADTDSPDPAGDSPDPAGGGELPASSGHPQPTTASRNGAD